MGSELFVMLAVFGYNDLPNATLLYLYPPRLVMNQQSGKTGVRFATRDVQLAANFEQKTSNV